MQTYDSIIFDVDGTVWNSTNVVEQAWNRALAESGYETRVTAKDLQGLFGLPMDEIIRRVLPGCTQEEIDRFTPLCYHYEHTFLDEQGGEIYDGFCDMIRELAKKYPLFVVSNCQSGYIELMYEKSGLGSYFTDQLCFGDNGLYKAANLRQIIEKHGLKNPVYVGDTVMDEEACDEAGIPIIYCAYGFGKANHPVAVIDAPMDLLKVLE
ncbi:MAG: HAD family hydrolase [Lachnospiraceae bacterium]|nr:HAD family hydrolase [Lachnospiraceae bacterium]